MDNNLKFALFYLWYDIHGSMPGRLWAGIHCSAPSGLDTGFAVRSVSPLGGIHCHAPSNLVIFGLSTFSCLGNRFAVS